MAWLQSPSYREVVLVLTPTNSKSPTLPRQIPSKFVSGDFQVKSKDWISTKVNRGYT